MRTTWPFLDLLLHRIPDRLWPASGFISGTTPETALGTSVLFLIPGVPLINSIFDLLEGHVLVGISRAVNALILIVCIALGLSVTLLILGLDTL